MLSVFVLSWALTLGVVPVQSDLVGGSLAVQDDSRIATIATLSFGITAWERLHIYTDLETYQYYNTGGLCFSPYRADYIFGAEFYINKYVTIGLSHECDHPVVSFTDMKADYKYLSNETKVFVRIGNER